MTIQHQSKSQQTSAHARVLRARGFGTQIVGRMNHSGNRHRMDSDNSPRVKFSGRWYYTDAAIQTSLLVRTAFSLPLRQTEGLMASVLTLMSLTISAPDRTTVSRRAVKLLAIRLEAKHGAKSRRKWRKLHLAVDAGSGTIVAQTLTDQDADDPSQVAPLLDRIGGRIARVTADGAYDGAPTYQTIAAHGDGIDVAIPPRSTAVPSSERVPPTQRDRHLEMIEERGRLAWQVATDYGQRSLVETTMGR